MKKWGISAVAAAIIAVALFVYIKSASPIPSGAETATQSQKTIEINSHVIDVDVVDTEAAREKGLGGRDSLAQEAGMLFVFQKDDTYAFWMKDMKFNIDIVWISADDRVVDLRQNESPDTYPSVFSPRSPARYVLELPANSVKRFNVHVGDIVRL